MDIIEAIVGRQSIDKVKPDALPRALIEQLLHAAAQAPNHYKARPWRFVVVSGAARERLGEVMAQSLKQRVPDASETVLAAEKARAFRAPVIIAVGVPAPEDPRQIEIEDVCAAAAATQNLLLAAHALGLGAKWRTGQYAYDPLIKEFLGFAPDQPLIALVYVGYPATERGPVTRPSFEDRTVWME